MTRQIHVTCRALRLRSITRGRWFAWPT